MKMYIINGDGYNMTVAADSDGGRIESDLHQEREPHFAPELDGHDVEDAQIDAVESLVLAHACAGIDVSSPAYVEGLNTTITTITQ